MSTVGVGTENAPAGGWLSLRETWTDIEADIRGVLYRNFTLPSRAAAVEVAEVICLMPIGVSRRLCEAATRLGPSTDDTSACVMVCHRNDTARCMMTVRVCESYSDYGLDRVAKFGDDGWQVHSRTVRYASPISDTANSDVVARALVRGKTLYQRVEPDSNTCTEAKHRMVAVHALLPESLTNVVDLGKVRPGVIVALNIDYYSFAHTGRQSSGTYGERFQDIQRFLNALYPISVLAAAFPDGHESELADLLLEAARRSPGSVSLAGLARDVVQNADRKWLLQTKPVD
ncbi:hypothetical protein VT84_07410 [Gemmata sp. SH-PL17]|uniref:hypothetical protein n=1 Tax=Gemmata sp. SH-PL17 TaxID=1630693 RepID=UPI00078B46A5|nr:hypothetical protein [Gemmata sp. SH-PL17]AMV24208.1 hypothetical protein VT84_07410 [Gemmata sp. SH-PL17]